MSNRNNGTMTTFTGLAAARGFASGEAFVYHREDNVSVPTDKIPAGGEQSEVERLRRARDTVRREIQSMAESVAATSAADAAVFECHTLILDDPILTGNAERLIMQERCNAAAASRQVANEMRASFAKLNEPYFRERVRDLDDVERHLITTLLDIRTNSLAALSRPSVIIADDLTPSEAIRLPRKLILGFATAEGSVTSHTVLLARSLGIPATVGMGSGIFTVRTGDHVLLDGTDGTLTLNPDSAAENAFSERIRINRECCAAISAASTGILADGGRVTLQANIHPGLPLDSIRKFGAAGIGLYRSEYLWLDRDRAPDEEEQFIAYREAVLAARSISSDASVTIRVLDIGGDKTTASATRHEDNPFLGNRSIRYLLSNRDAFATQLRAILRASAFGNVRIMYPMISCCEELAESNRILTDAKRTLDLNGIAYDRTIKIGTMIEVPSAAINADALAQLTDFFSIGTNDLIQYTMAADRTNDAVANLYQPTNPAILRLISGTIAAARRHHIPVSVCGESASDPVEGTLWVAMGADALSMSASYIPSVSAILNQLTRQQLDGYAAAVMSLDPTLPASEIRSLARRHLAKLVPDMEDILS